MTDMGFIIFTMMISSLSEVGSESDAEFLEIYSLIQKQEFRAAGMLAERVVEDEPDNVNVKYLLGFVHATAEGGDLEEAVRLALEVATWRRDLREKAASLALEAAVNSQDDTLLKSAVEVILDHQHRHLLFSNGIIRDAMVRSAEMLLLNGDIGKARTLLSQNLVEGCLELDILRLFLMKLDERKQNVKETRASKSLLESLKLITHDEGRLEEVEKPKMMMGRMVTRWRQRPELRVECDVMMGVLVELGVFPSKEQMPSWTERGLTSRWHNTIIQVRTLLLRRPVWDLASLGPEMEATLKRAEAQWDQLRREAEVVVAKHSWTSPEAGAWTQGETHIAYDK